MNALGCPPLVPGTFETFNTRTTELDNLVHDLSVTRLIFVMFGGYPRSIQKMIFGLRFQKKGPRGLLMIYEETSTKLDK